MYLIYATSAILAFLCHPCNGVLMHKPAAKLSWTPPKYTGSPDEVDQGRGPAPTAVPPLDESGFELVKRINGSNTCGYIFGLSSTSLP